MKVLPIIVIIFFIGCNTRQGESQFHIKTAPDSLNQSLIGKWGGLNETTPVWNIKLDSIYYYSEHKSYPYKISKGDLFIYRDSTVGILRNISVTKDTMQFQDPPGVRINAYRFPEK
jgi:hypothetical protein